MSRKLHKSLQVQKNKTEQVKLPIYGSLGIPLGGRKVVEVANRQGYVYVRLRDNQNEVIQAFNNKVSASYDLPVILVRDGSRYVIQQFNAQRYLNNAQNPTAFLPGHGTQHSFPRGGGADTTWIYAQQIMPGLVYPNAVTGTNVIVDKYPLYTPDGRWVYAGGTGTVDLIPYRPTTGSSSLMALVFLDSYTGNPGVLVGSGSYFPANISGSIYPYLPQPTATQIPLAGVLLTTGTNNITWENLYDVRQWIHHTPTGTSSGGGGGGGGIDTIGFAGLYNGIPLGTGTFLNVHGDNVTFTKSGSMFDLNISSPQSTPFTGIPIYNNNQFVATGTSISFNTNVSVVASGTSIFVRFPVTTYFRVGQPSPLSIPSGLYWIVPDGVYATGSLGIHIQGHALIPGVDYVEQYAQSGTYQYLLAPPTGTYHLAYYGVPCTSLL